MKCLTKTAIAVATTAALSVTANLSATNAANQPATSVAVPIAADQLQEATRINALSGELLAARLQHGDFGNAMVSSVSLFYAMAQLQEGARGQSSALIETLLLNGEGEVGALAPPLAGALTYWPESTDSPRGRFALHNAVWATSGESDGQPFYFVRDYLARIAEAYGSTDHRIDFKAKGASKEVNEWADEKTDGLIDEIIDDETLSELVWLIINAAYFEGAWATPMARVPADDSYRFQLVSGESAAAETVRSTQTMGVYDPPDGSVAFSVPFNGGKYAMVLHVAPQEMNDTRAWLLDAAVPEQAATIGALLGGEAARFDVNLRMPVFAYDDRLTLEKRSPATLELGMAPLFSNDANYSGLVDLERSHPNVARTTVGLIQQDTRIELDEKGVKAAAVTKIGGIRATSVGPRFPRRDIVVDRPFSWAIVELRSQTILFNGVFVDPDN